MIDMKPYVQWKKDDYILRVFHPQVDNDELVWHRDKNDRLVEVVDSDGWLFQFCLLYTSPSPRDKRQSRMPSSA